MVAVEAIVRSDDSPARRLIIPFPSRKQVGWQKNMRAAVDTDPFAGELVPHLRPSAKCS
jgi:hypothetical protein